MWHISCRYCTASKEALLLFLVPFYFYLYLVCSFLSLFDVIMFGAPELWWWVRCWFDLCCYSNVSYVLPHIGTWCFCCTCWNMSNSTPSPSPYAFTEHCLLCQLWLSVLYWERVQSSLDFRFLLCWVLFLCRINCGLTVHTDCVSVRACVVGCQTQPCIVQVCVVIRPSVCLSVCPFE